MSSACRGRVMALPLAHLRRRPARVRATAPALALGVAARCAHQLGERADEDLVVGPVQLARLPLHLLPEPPLEAARGEHQLAQQRARAAKEGDEPRAQRAAQVRPDRAAPSKPAAALARHVVLREPLERTLLEDVEQVAPHLATEIPRGPPRSAEISKVDGRGGAAPAPSGCGGGGGRGPCPAPHRPTDVRWACDARVADEPASLRLRGAPSRRLRRAGRPRAAASRCHAYRKAPRRLRGCPGGEGNTTMPRPAQTSNMTAPLPPSWPSAGSPTLCNARRTRQTTAYACGDVWHGPVADTARTRHEAGRRPRLCQLLEQPPPHASPELCAALVAEQCAEPRLPHQPLQVAVSWVAARDLAAPKLDVGVPARSL